MEEAIGAYGQNEIKMSSTLYPAYGTVGRGNLVLRNYVLPIFLRFWVLSGGTQHRAFGLVPERETINK